jgi:prepilin-type N-terminal cleavage/methylation domain-containing protein
MSTSRRPVSARRARTVCGRSRTVGGLFTDPRCAHGFTLIEALLVAAIVSILSAIALPSLERARSVAREVSTIGSLRALNTAQASFASSCGGGSYSPTVALLSVAPAGKGMAKAAFIGPGYTADIIDMAGYRIRFTKGVVVATAPATCNGLAAKSTVQSYYIAGDPLATGPGMPIRYFGTSSGGTIYQSTVRLTAFYSGVPPAPAKPIQ